MKIVIANPAKEWMQSVLSHPLSKKYQFKITTDSADCLNLIDSFAPDLVLADLMLHHMHGIEILKKIKNNPKTKTLGFIITSWYPMIQNYQAAINLGSNEFISLPISIPKLYEIFERFFSKKLTPTPFESLSADIEQGQHCYLPKAHPEGNYIKFWGTRGSTPVAGPDYIRFGGNTVCLEIREGDDRVIIDAGTGIRELGHIISSSKDKKIHLFLGHTHWDHIIGFPFFAPLIHGGVEIILYSPVGFEKSTQEMFLEMFAYSFFPVRLDDLQAKITFQEMRDGEIIKVGKISVETHYAFHPGPTFCYKIKTSKKTFGYATDNEFLLGYHGNPNLLELTDPLLEPYLSQINFFKGCDLLIHEAQYTPIEYQERVGWGHSSVSNATYLIKAAGIKEWIVTHHSPVHTDEALQKKIQLHLDTLRDCNWDCYVRVAYDGLNIPL